MSNMIKLLNQQKPGRILDVATGSGNYLKFLTDNIPCVTEAVGIDTKQTAAEPFTEMFQQDARVRFLVMPAEKMDFPDAFFDIVSISNSLHHLAKPDLAVQGMVRVLKPGGFFILNEMFRDGDQTPAQQTHILLHHWFGQVDTSQNIYHNPTYTRQQLMDFVLLDNLELIEVEDQIDVSGDPRDPQIFDELDPVIQRYIERAEGNKNLQKRGYDLQKRLKSIGFHNASSLQLLAKKAILSQ